MNKQKISHVILHLSLIDGVGPIKIKTIASKKPETCTWDELYNFKTSDLINTFGFTKMQAEKIVNGLQDKQLLEKELNLIACHNIKWITFLHNEYPELLKHIHVPPAVIYWRGSMINNDEKTIAFVGARKANYYGQRVINQLIPDLVQHDWVIVSGGAVGADSMAHHATVQAGGKTVVVLGSGILCPYPTSNIKLFDQVCGAGGILLSVFPLQMEAMPGNFPARNRIISGLSRGCVVVQAGAKSGARITARYALEQGREVFAVPGPLDDVLSIGCHLLIQEGAQLINSADDIFNEFGEKIKDQKAVVVATKSVNQSVFKTDNSLQTRIIRACYTPSFIDDLVVKLNISLPELQAELLDLQLMGSVVQNFTGMWVTQ